MNDLWEAIATSLTITSVGLTLLFAGLKKWFLDLETYETDTKTKDLKAEENETRLLQKIEDVAEALRKEKADSEDLAKSEQRIEKLDNRLAELTATMEKQSCRLDMLIESRNEILQVSKEIKTELSDHLKELKADITEVKNTNTSMQLDIAALKSKLG